MVISHQVFPHFTDQSEALVKITGMLKPGGRLVISHFISSAEINKIHNRIASAVAYDVMPPPEIMQKLLGQYGFSIVNWLDDSTGYLLMAKLKTQIV